VNSDLTGDFSSQQVREALAACGTGSAKFYLIWWPAVLYVGESGKEFLARVLDWRCQNIISLQGRVQKCFQAAIYKSNNCVITVSPSAEHVSNLPFLAITSFSSGSIAVLFLDTHIIDSL